MNLVRVEDAPARGLNSECSGYDKTHWLASMVNPAGDPPVSWTLREA